MSPWRPDRVLGDGYVQRVVHLDPDDEGEVVGTLIHRVRRHDEASARWPILVLHGWSDYIFQRDLLEHLAALGLDVWALDLRKHGRSLRGHQTPTDVRALSEYDAEIDAALEAIGPDRPPLVLAHSTGGLVAALWALRHPHRLRALALNSPWLELHLGPAARRAILPLARALSRRAPHRPALPPGTDHFARTIHRDLGGELDFDLAWKPARGHRLTRGTLAAVLEGQEVLRHGRLELPVLVLRSDRSRFRPWFDERMRRSDVVLEVRGMDAAARRLGPEVHVAVIPGARHDVFLSEPDARERAFSVLDAWIEDQLVPGDDDDGMRRDERSPRPLGLR